MTSGLFRILKPPAFVVPTSLSECRRERQPLLSVPSTYWVQHHDPVGLLGYMRVLEGNPPSEAHINNLQRQSRLPASVFRTYRMHGELDPNHHRELDLFIDSLPLTGSQTRLILESASHTASTLAVCIDALEPRVTLGKRSTDGRL